MSLNSLTEVLDNLYTTTWQNMSSTVADNVFAASPLWFWFKDGGRLVPENGGRFLTEPLEYDSNDSVTWIGKGGSVQLSDYEFLTVAKYDWKYLVASMVRFGQDDQQNRGKNQIINFMNSKMSNTSNALITELETALCAGSGTGAGPNGSNRFDGLQLQVPDAPTVTGSTLGGIDPSVYTWWRSQMTDMTGQSFASYGVSNLRTLLNNCMNNRAQDRPDIICSGQSQFEYYEDGLLSYYRIHDNKLGDAGFENLKYKGIPWIWTPSMTNRIYCLNTKYIKVKYDPMMFFSMTDWKGIPNQVNDRAAQIISAMSMVMSRRLCQGVLINVTTP
jgi:hypothetical protein